MSSSGLRALAFFGLLSLAPPLVLAQQVQGRPAPPRPQAPLPVPEFHGTYAVLEGKLLGLDVPAASTATPQLVEIKVGAFAGAAAILDRKPLVSYRTLKVPVLPKNLQFVCFYQTSGLISGMTAASQIKLRPVPFVRKVTANTGWPNQVLVSGPGRSWAADTLGGGLMSSVGAGTPDWLAPIGLLTKPMPGHPDMIIGVPERALEAGLYQLAIGDEPKELATRPPAYFAIGPMADAEKLKCLDVSIAYQMTGSTTDAVTCEAAGPYNDEEFDSRNRPVTPPEPPKPICKDAGECFQKGRDESVARRFAAAIPFLQRALELEPGHLLSLQLLGAIEANAGNYDAAGGYMEQVVKRGGDVLFGVMRERSLSYDTGHILTINRNIITLTNPKSQAVFAEQPSKVEPREIRRMSRTDRMMPHENASLEVRAATKKYVLYPMPRGVECVSSVSGPFPDCPGGGDLMFGYAGLIKRVIAAAATVPAGK